MRKITIKYLHRKLSRITVNEALWLLKVYLASSNEFCILGRTGMVYAATAGDLLRDYAWIKPGEPASMVPVRFLGGPLPEVSGVPRKYYNGSLVTFVVDRVLSGFATRGVDYHWLRKFNGNSVLPLWEQLKKRYPKGLGADLSPPPVNGPKQLPLFDNIDVSNYVENRVVETAKVGGHLIEIFSDGTQGPARETYHPHSLGYDQPVNDENYSWL
jgi:hypothetical protein